MNERTKEHGEWIRQLRLDVSKLTELKQDKSNFQEQQMRIKEQFDIVNLDIDTNKNNIKKMEHFIDKYTPIRTQQQIGDTLKAVISQTQM